MDSPATRGVDAGRESEEAVHQVGEFFGQESPVSLTCPRRCRSCGAREGRTTAKAPVGRRIARSKVCRDQVLSPKSCARHRAGGPRTVGRRSWRSGSTRTAASAVIDVFSPSAPGAEVAARPGHPLEGEHPREVRSSSSSSSRSRSRSRSGVPVLPPPSAHPPTGCDLAGGPRQERL